MSAVKAHRRLLWGVSVLILCAGVVLCQRGFTLCEVQGCNCTSAAPTIAWKNVNCNLHAEQELTLEKDHIPKEAMEVAIVGGKSITFSPKAFNSFEGLFLLRIDGTKRVAMKKKSFYNITSSSLHVQVQSCDELVIDGGAFEDMQSYPTFECMDITYVSLSKAVFSKLTRADFKRIGTVELEEGTFEFKNMGSVGKHGPVTVIHFDSVYIPKLPREVFASSLAGITFKSCRVNDIESQAFRATQISAITFLNSSIGVIHTNAASGNTLVDTLRIDKTSIETIESEAFVGAIANLTVYNSIITDIESRAIISTSAKVEIIDNELFNVQKCAFCVSSWNKIIMDSNIIKKLSSNFIDTEKHAGIERFSFKSNEIYTVEDGSLNFIPKIKENVLTFDDNFFNVSCACHMDEWVEKVTNSSEKNPLVLQTSFCTVNKLLSECFSLPVGIINMENFTEKACTNKTECKPYNGEIRIVDTTSKIYLEADDSEKQSWLILIITVVGLFIIALVVTFVVLVVRASRWLKRKGYFRNAHYTSNGQSNEDEENTIVTIDENEKLEIPEELTLEFLQELSQRLDDPATHQEASEMIERLYEMFIIDDSYENNNRQDEEAHLYEELGNLNLQIPPPPYEEQPKPQPTSGARGILKIMEEKFNTNTNEINAKPALAGDYSEPTDAAVHLYSELKEKSESGNTGSLHSNKSGSMALRPLPDKPGSSREAGPSSQP